MTVTELKARGAEIAGDINLVNFEERSIEADAWLDEVLALADDSGYPSNEKKKIKESLYEASNYQEKVPIRYYTSAMFGTSFELETDRKLEEFRKKVSLIIEIIDKYF